MPREMHLSSIGEQVGGHDFVIIIESRNRGSYHAAGLYLAVARLIARQI